jgi:thioredoxin
MATIAMTIDNFEDTILNNDIVLIDFWADWCGPCKAFGPVFERVSEKHPDMVFAKVDTESEQEIAAQFGIRSIPTLAIFREKVLLFNQAGALQEATLEDVVARVKDLDMDEVRTAIADEKAKAEAGGEPSNDA